MGVLYNRSTSEILSERVDLVQTRFKPISALLVMIFGPVAAQLLNQ